MSMNPITSPTPSPSPPPCQWLQKYHPSNVADLIGNVRLMRQLKEWLSTVQRHNAHNAPSVSAEEEGVHAGVSTACVHSVTRPVPITFLYGPSGIGKTALARAILEHCNFHVYELNAGCIRSKKRIEDALTKIMGNQSVSIMRHCHQTIGILMDEVDGMSCGDKGGLHELFQIVQEQQKYGALIHPVICIGTRPYEKRLPDNVYQEFAVRRPSEQEIVKRLRYICDCEHVRIDDIALLLVAKYGAQDVRRTVHFLQELVFFFGNDGDREISIEDVETVKEVTTKTRVDRNLFHITSDVFAREHSAQALYDLYATDKNLVPMMVHENAPAQMQQKDIPADRWMVTYTDLLEQYSVSDALANSGCWELGYAHSALFCGWTNERIGRHPSKSSASKKIQFTNTLTKSATQTNTYTVLARLSTLLGIHISEFSKVVPLILYDLREAPEHARRYPLTYNDVEKLLQLYNKWWPSTTDRALSFTAKQKRVLKKLLAVG